MPGNPRYTEGRNMKEVMSVVRTLFLFRPRKPWVGIMCNYCGTSSIFSLAFNGREWFPGTYPPPCGMGETENNAVWVMGFVFWLLASVTFSWA